MQAPDSPKSPLLFAWLILLAVSDLPKILLQEVFGQSVSAGWQTVFSLAVLLAGFLATLVWKPLRLLRPYLVVFLTLVAARWLVYTQIDRLPFFQTWLRRPSFNAYMLAEEALNVIVTLLMIAVLFALKRDRRAFFLARGDLSAPAEPIRWLGVKPGASWKHLGRDLTIYISLGTLAFLILAGRPSLEVVVLALPFLPAILLASALNAFTEELTYKASLLSTLENPLGKRQALYLTAAFFGIGHYYGVPYGVIGVLMAGFMGWILSRSMLETRGLFWAWFIHFWQDVLIFTFMAIGSVTPGGG
jgi:hypothetical protein